MPELETQECRNNHMGIWLAPPEEMEWRIQAVRSGLVASKEPEQLAIANPGAPTLEELGVTILGHTAFLRVGDVMMRNKSKYGGCSTRLLRAQMRAIRTSAEIRGIKNVALLCNSPGGHLDGQEELLDELEALAAAVPVYAYVEYLGASAAFWLISMCQAVFASRTAMVGAIGVYTVLEDVSQVYGDAGVKVHVVRSGERKGAGVRGAPITKEDLAEVQSRVDFISGLFEADIRDRRPRWSGGTEGGRTFTAENAKKLGLIDGVLSYSKFIELVTEETGVTMAEHLSKLEQEALTQEEQGEVAKTEEEESAEEEEEEGKAKKEEEAAEEEEEEEEEEEGKGDDEEPKAAVVASTFSIEDVRLEVARAVAKEVGIEPPESATAEQIVAQVKTLIANSDKKPTLDKGTTKSDRSAALAKRNEYQEKYGAAEGGALFKQREPELFGLL